SRDWLFSRNTCAPPLEEALGAGWYEEERDENGCWRWTARVFEMRLRPPRDGASSIRLRFRLPAAIIHETGPLHIKASIAGRILPDCEYSTAGEHIYAQRLPVIIREQIVTVRFELDKSYGPKPADPRELGVQ